MVVWSCCEQVPRLVVEAVGIMFLFLPDWDVEMSIQGGSPVNVSLTSVVHNYSHAQVYSSNQHQCSVRQIEIKAIFWLPVLNLASRINEDFRPSFAFRPMNVCEARPQSCPLTTGECPGAPV